MKMSRLLTVSLLAMGLSVEVSAQEQDISVLPNIKSEIGISATQNIEKAERLFCYKVANKPQNYDGYTINNMAITGFCGIIDDNLRAMITEQLFANEANIDFIGQENCTIQPQVLLRYVRGVDNTDVLLSNPCHSASVFYGGSIKTFNMKPAAEVITTIVNAFNASQAKFVSPALLNQLLPIGVAQTTEQKALLQQPAQVKNNWQTKTQDVNSQPKTQGWNNLEFKN